MRQEINDQEKAKADDIWLTTMETLSETQKQKDEEKGKTIKKKTSGGDVVQY